MHVEKDHAIPFVDRRAVDAGERSARRVDHAGRDVSWNDRIRHAGEPAVPEMHVGAADFGTFRAKERGANREIRTGEMAELDRRAWRGHHRGENIGHAVYVILERMLIQTLSALAVACAIAAPAAAQSQVYTPKKARKHFISLTLDRQFVQPYSFAKHPLEELLGQRVNEVHLQDYQYETQDKQTKVTVLEYGKRASGFGATVYPFGSSDGATLAIRASIESMPDIRVAFSGPAPSAGYQLTGGRATDIGAGLEMSDRSPGWGIGGHAFIIGGIGRAHTDQMDGRRYFGEGGGGIMFGPFGVDLSVKYAVNSFDAPVSHSVHMIPICVRGTLTF